MTKRTLAALLALLVAAATLAVVASPAAAHSQTKQQCAYDPFAGNQCWTVNVSHTHSCPAGMTGTPPKCYPAPSTNQPNKGDEEAKKAAEEARKRAEQEAKRKAEEEAKRKADEEAKRKADEEARRQRRAAEEEARRRAEQEAKRKAAEEAERKRKEAEEAERKRKKAEEDANKCPPRQTGTPPDCRTDLRLCGTPQSTAHAKECEEERKRQKTEKDAEKKAKEEANKPTPCGGSGGQGSTAHHKHGGPCHADTPNHTHPVSTAKCPLSYKYNADLKLCELTGNSKFIQDGARIGLWVEGQALCFFGADRVATKVVNTILKGANEALKAVSKLTFEQKVQAPCDHIWSKLTTWSMNYRPDHVVPKTSGGDDGEGADVDDDDGITTVEDVNKAAEQLASGKISDAEYNRIKNAYFCTTVKLESYCPGGVHNPTPASDSDDAEADPSDQKNVNNAQDQNGDDAEADDDSDTPKTGAEWDQAVKDAEAKWRRGEIDGDELTRIQNERDCAKGYAWAQNCT